MGRWLPARSGTADGPANGLDFWIGSTVDFNLAIVKEKESGKWQVNSVSVVEHR